jgi:D-cysteine desulfhydrase
MRDTATPPGRPPSPEPPLYQAAPSLRERLPREEIGSFPTPVEVMAVAGRTILVKQDGLCAEGYAGNKVRKLEYLLAAARSQGARRLVTAGATGSHHALATAYHGRRLGFEVTLVLFPQRLTTHVRAILLMDAAVGAGLRWIGRMEAVPFGLWRAARAHRADAPYIVPPGGSSEIGTLGYVNAGLELAEQVSTGAAPRPSRIHVAAGTLGTAAGIALGLAWAGLDVPIMATRITSRVVTNQRALAGLLSRTVRLLQRVGARPPGAADALRLVDLRHDQIGDGYGRVTPAAARAQALFAEAGMRLDDTYTAKAAAGLLAMADVGDPPLYWHTLSAVEPTHLVGSVDPAALPPPFARYLAAAED